jgi:GDSL-like lipase/acylhydrolase family protein
MVLLAAAVMVVLFEAGTRAVGLRYPRLPRPGESGDRGLWVYHASRGWAPAPGATGTAFLGGPDRAEVRINSLGLRGPELSRVPPAGRRRVLVLGDSFVFGVGVDEGHTFSAELARELGEAYEVVNAGVSGYSTDQEYLLFQELGQPLGASLVVLVMCDNDFAGNVQDFAYGAYYKPYYEPGPEGLGLRNQPVPRRTRGEEARLWLGQRSNAWNALREATRRLTGSEGWLGVARPRVTHADPVAVTAALVLALRDAAAAGGAPLVVFNTGHRGEDTTRFHALRPALRREGVPLLGFEETMALARAENPAGQWDFGHDTHWGVDAHRLAGRVGAAFLRKVGVVDQ